MNLWCVGRNYQEHARELGNSVPTEPLIFLKAGSCQVLGDQFQLPSWAQEVHHEIEIAFRFSKKISSLGTADFSLNSLTSIFDEVALALDLTERHQQNLLKSKGQPWTLAKCFRQSAPFSISRSVPMRDFWNEAQDWPLTLEINDEIRQKGRGQEMVFSPLSLAQFVFERFPVKAGDWLLTGTPSGVGALHRGDQVTALWGPQGNPFLRHTWAVL